MSIKTGRWTLTFTHVTFMCIIWACKAPYTQWVTLNPCPQRTHKLQETTYMQPVLPRRVNTEGIKLKYGQKQEDLTRKLKQAVKFQKKGRIFTIETLEISRCQFSTWLSDNRQGRSDIKWHGIWRSRQHFLMSDKYSSSKEKRRIFLYFCEFCKGIGPCLAGKIVLPCLDTMSLKCRWLSEEPPWDCPTPFILTWHLWSNLPSSFGFVLWGGNELTNLQS